MVLYRAVGTPTGRASAALIPDDVLEAEIIDDAHHQQRPRRTRTRLEFFLESHGIKPAHVARESGYSRQHLLRLRMGEMEPTRACIVAIVEACRRLTREEVSASDLFYLADRPRARRKPSRRALAPAPVSGE